MSGLNKVMLIGNLGKDPEMRFTPNGKPVTNFTVASNDGQETEWFNVVTWNKVAENTNQYLSKGSKVYVEGRLHTNQWDGEDGKTHYRTELIANRVVFLDKPSQKPTDPDDLF